MASLLITIWATQRYFFISKTGSSMLWDCWQKVVYQPFLLHNKKACESFECTMQCTGLHTLHSENPYEMATSNIGHYIVNREWIPTAIDVLISGVCYNQTNILHVHPNCAIVSHSNFVSNTFFFSLPPTPQIKSLIIASVALQANLSPLLYLRVCPYSRPHYSI